MAESVPFKNFFNVALAQGLADRIRTVYAAFEAESFVQHIAAHIGTLELKARISLIAQALRRWLPPDYPQALEIILKILGPEFQAEQGMFNDGWWIGPLAEYVEVYGLEHPDLSIDALHAITRRYTAEFGLRPYLVRYPDRTLAALHEWAHDPNPHVRRAVSESTRTRLPWARRLDSFIRDPQPVIVLLEKLKDDPSEYVRKSVANNLNDLAKDHPEQIVALLADWYKDGSDGTRWIVRHALRTLIKRGDPAALAILGYADDVEIVLDKVTVIPNRVPSGGTLQIALALHNPGESAHKLVVDFVIHFMKSNGKTSPKVFKWTTSELGPGERLALSRTFSFRPVTTRKYYPGAHRMEIQVNGKILGSADFVLEG